MAISPFRPDARGMTAAVPQMASVYNDLKEGSPFRAGGPDLSGFGQSAPGPGMPYGRPLDTRALEGATQGVNPGAAMGPWRAPPRVLQNAGEMDPRRAGAAGASSQSPWAAYGGAFGGVNQNDLYRKNAPNTAGPNGMMGPAPNLDFNAQARSQVGGQGARLAASKPWEGAFGDLWRRSTDSEYRVLAEASKRKNPDGSRGSSLFGQIPRNPDGTMMNREQYNRDTGVSYGYKSNQDPVWGYDLGIPPGEEGYDSGSGYGSLSGLSDEELEKNLMLPGRNKEIEYRKQQAQIAAQNAQPKPKAK